MEEKSLYERLGGAFAIAAVVDRFSDQIMEDAQVGRNSTNPYLKEWATHQKERLPGLKFMRTLWVCAAAGGPMKYAGTRPGATPMGLEKAHFDLHITSEEFDQVAAILARTLDEFRVPEREKKEVLGAFAAHKSEVITGSRAMAKSSKP